MKNKLYILFLFCFLFFVYVSGFCQDLNYAVLYRKNIVYLLGYSRVSEINGTKIIFTGSITPLQILIDRGISLLNYGGKIGMQIPIFVNNNIIITPNINISGLQYYNVAYDYTGFNSDININVGYYKLKWFVAGTAGIEIRVGSYYRFSSEQYENLYKPWFHKGWNYNNKLYSNPQVGLMYGYTIKQRTDLLIGYKKRGSGNLFYLENIFMGINYRFGKKSENDNK